MKFDRSKNLRSFLDKFLIFQTFDRFVSIVKKSNPDDAQNVRHFFLLNILNFLQPFFLKSKKLFSDKI